MKISPFTIMLWGALCYTESVQSQGFYFPVKNFLKEHTYCFVNKNDTREKEFWKMKTTVSGGDTLFQTSILDSKKRITELMVENICNGNAKIVTYSLYEYPPAGDKISTNFTIIDSLVFKSDQKESEQIQWKVNYKISFLPGMPDFLYELTRVRTLQSQTSDKQIFYDFMKVTSHTNPDYTYSIISVYQKDKGRISYKVISAFTREKDFVLKWIK